MTEKQQFIKGLLIELCKNGYECRLDEDEIKVIQNSISVMSLRTDGTYTLNGISGNDTVHKVLAVYKSLKEAYVLYFASPPLEYVNLERYHKLADFNNHILAACMKSDGSLEFVTWQKAYKRTALTTGNYFNDYECVKKDFVVRSGLVDPYKIFDENELKLIHKGLIYFGADYLLLTAKQIANIGKIIEKIEMIVPVLDKHEETTDYELTYDDGLFL